MNARPPVRLAELDALRGLSALAVGLYHLTFFVPAMLPGAPLPSIRLWWGCYGVQVFFAISGFVILGTLERGRDPGRFALARVRRLFPEYWAAMTVTTVVVALIGPPRFRVDIATWIGNLPMLQLLTGVRMIDGVYWSLSVELIFYAAMAIAWWSGAMRRAEVVVLALIALKWLAWAWPGIAPVGLALLLDQAAYFAIGLIAYRVWTGERHWTSQLPVLAGVFATVLLLDPVEARWLFAGLAPGFLVLATGRMRWLARPVLVRMGVLSYPFYLLHATIGYCVIARLERDGVSADAATLAALATTALLAAMMAIAFERGRRGRHGIARATGAAVPA